MVSSSKEVYMEIPMTENVQDLGEVVISAHGKDVPLNKMALSGGALSSLSNKVLGNSDFLSAAFPAEYWNAVSGVFDMRIRNGNTEKHEHTPQVGILGIDLASKGPTDKKHNSSSYYKL